MMPSQVGTPSVPRTYVFLSFFAVVVKLPPPPQTGPASNRSPALSRSLSLSLALYPDGMTDGITDD